MWDQQDLQDTIARAKLLIQQSSDPGIHNYAVLVYVFASLGGLFMGHDQGETSAVLSMASFLWCWATSSRPSRSLQAEMATRTTLAAPRRLAASLCWARPSSCSTLPSAGAPCAAEIFPMKVRSTAVSFSTMANWVMGVVMTYVVKLFPSPNINGVFFLFTATCCVSGTFVFFFCPEAKGMLLEDIEAVFHTQASPRYSEAGPREQSRQGK